MLCLGDHGRDPGPAAGADHHAQYHRPAGQPGEHLGQDQYRRAGHPGAGRRQGRNRRAGRIDGADAHQHQGPHRTYAQPQRGLRPKSVGGSMESLLNDVNAVIGVTGSFVGIGRAASWPAPSVGVRRPFTRNRGAHDDDRPSPVWRRRRRRKVGDIDMLFREGRLIMKPFNEGCLGIVCVPRFNVALLNLTANVTLRKIHEELKQQAAAQAEAVAPPAAAAAAPGCPRPGELAPGGRRPGAGPGGARAQAPAARDGRHGGSAALPDGLDLSRHGGRRDHRVRRARAGNRVRSST